MAFDKTQPVPTTKIRNLSTVIPDNFAAIEEADSTFQPYAINLIDRTGASISPVTPDTIATSNILFSKNDGSAIELFCKDASGNVIQLTSAGKIGSSSTNIVCDNLNFNTLTDSNGNARILTAACSWNSATSGSGTLSAINCTLSRGATGIYSITFTTPFSDTNYYVSAIGGPSGTGQRFIYVYSKSTTKVVLQMVNENGSARWDYGSMMVFGGST